MQIELGDTAEMVQSICGFIVSANARRTLTKQQSKVEKKFDEPMQSKWNKNTFGFECAPSITSNDLNVTGSTCQIRDAFVVSIP